VKLIVFVSICRILTLQGTAEETRTCQKWDEKEPFWKEVMSYGNLLYHGDILLHQSQKDFNSCDLGEVSLSFIGK
jgi:hypothetical protein